MKGLTAWGLGFMCIAGLLAGCSTGEKSVNNAAGITASNTTDNISGNTVGKTTDNTVALKLDMRGNYTGFAGLPKDCTMKEAEAAGYVVLHNNAVAAGQEVWDRFVEQTAQGSDAGIRMTHFFDDEADSPFYNDLIYQDSQYYFFDSTAESGKQQPSFSFMLNLAGQMGNPLKDSKLIVLTNDSDLTFTDVWKSMISSDTAVINSIAPHRIVRWFIE